VKALNLYAGIGGNRKLWTGCEVTAVELSADIARIYQDLFPQDTVIVGDAHQYLVEHYAEFNFIWTSPPCPTHSQYRYNVGVRAKGFSGVYPDMTLYQEIIFLKHHAAGAWVVENTVSYYEPLIPPQKVSRHFMWANFTIPPISVETTGIRDKNKIHQLEAFFGYDLSRYSVPNKRQMLRNLVSPEIGLHVFRASNKVLQPTADHAEVENHSHQPGLL
jgi:DNA (cytosine-5)-methyltransferase 1